MAMTRLRPALLLRSLVLLVFTLATPAMAEAGKVNISTQYFIVHGSTLDELEEYMLKNGQAIQDKGLRHPGAAEISFEGNVAYARTPEGLCSVADDPEIILNAVMVLPKWNAPPDADSKTVISWNVIAGDIEGHEKHHVLIAEEWHRKLIAALSALPPQQTCDQMKAMVRQTTTRYLQGHADAQAAFDRAEYARFDARLKRQLAEALAEN